MSSYLVIDATTLITLAKADIQTSNALNTNPNKGQFYLNQLLNPSYALLRYRQESLRER